MPPTPVAIALGSNLGDRRAHLHDAVGALGGLLQDLRTSSLYRTSPVGVGAQPDFLNMAVVGHTTLAPEMLLQALLAMEASAGRVRPYPGAPRTLDLDVILYGATTLKVPGLTLPHPRFRERRFVLAPLAEIAGDWRDPVTGLLVSELLARVPD